MGAIQNKLNETTGGLVGIAAIGSHLANEKQELKNQEEVKKLESLKAQDSQQRKTNEAIEGVSEIEKEQESLNKQFNAKHKEMSQWEKDVKEGKIVDRDVKTKGKGTWEAETTVINRQGQAQKVKARPIEKQRQMFREALNELRGKKALAREELSKRVEHLNNIQNQNKLFKEQTGLDITERLTYGQKMDVLREMKKREDDYIKTGHYSNEPLKIRNYNKEK